MTQDTVYSTTVRLHSPTQPQISGPFVSKRVRGPLLNVRVLGGVEVPVGRRLAIVGTVKGDSSDLDDRSRTVVAVAGVRFSLK